MEDLRFELFSDTVYTLIPLLKRHFLPSPESAEYGSVTRSLLPLLFLLHSAGSITMSEAARRIGASKPHMTLQAERLVEEGLIERRAASDDRRIVTIRLTPKGAEIVRRIKAATKERAHTLFSGLSDETIERILGALLTLKEAVMNVEKKETGAKRD